LIYQLKLEQKNFGCQIAKSTQAILIGVNIGVFILFKNAPGSVWRSFAGVVMTQDYIKK
jgi:hypothetical protein